MKKKLRDCTYREMNRHCHDFLARGINCENCPCYTITGCLVAKHPNWLCPDELDLEIDIPEEEVARKYRKKPIVVEAYRTDVEMDIDTLEGVMHASKGDYIITGANGEKYPCKPDIFEKTYELVEE